MTTYYVPGIMLGSKYTKLLTLPHCVPEGDKKTRLALVVSSQRTVSVKYCYTFLLDYMLPPSKAHVCASHQPKPLLDQYLRWGWSLPKSLLAHPLSQNPSLPLENALSPLVVRLPVEGAYPSQGVRSKPSHSLSLLFWKVKPSQVKRLDTWNLGNLSLAPAIRPLELPRFSFAFYSLSNLLP